MLNSTINYNKKLLTAINSVSAGTNTSVVLYYNAISETKYIGEVQNALAQWQLFFNTLYHSSRTNNRSGNLDLSFEVSSTESLDIKFTINGEYTLSNSPSNNMAISYLIHFIGESLGFKNSSRNSPMNPLNVKNNYIFLSDVNITKDGSILGNGLITYTKLIEDTYKLYGNPRIKNSMVYGCIDATAENYNPDATISDGSCASKQNSAISDSKLQDNIIHSRDLPANIDSPSTLIQFNYNNEYFSYTASGVWGPHLGYDVSGFEELNSIHATNSSTDNDHLVRTSSSIFTNGRGTNLFTAFAFLDKLFIYDRLGNKLNPQDSLTPSWNTESPESAVQNVQSINTNIITFGDQNISAYTIVDNRGFIRINWVDSTLPNYNSSGGEIIDCREGGPFGSALGNSLGETLIQADAFGGSSFGNLYGSFDWEDAEKDVINDNETNRRQFSSSGYTTGIINSVSGSSVGDKGYYKSTPISLTNAFSNVLSHNEDNTVIKGARFNKLLHFDVYSGTYLIYNTVTPKGEDGQNAEAIGMFPSNWGQDSSAEFIHPYIFDLDVRRTLYNRILTIGSFDETTPTLMYSYLKGFSFSQDSRNIHTIAGNGYNFETNTFNIVSGEHVEVTTDPLTSPSRLNVDEVLSQTPIVRGNRRRYVSGDYSTHFNVELAEYSPSSGSMEEYSDGVFLVAYGVAHGFIIMSVTSTGIFIPPADGGVEIHIPGGVINDEKTSEFQGMKPISACFSRLDNFLYAIVEGEGVDDRYVVVYNTSTIMEGDGAAKAQMIISDALILENPLSSILSKIELDHENNVWVFGEDESEEYGRIIMADTVLGIMDFTSFTTINTLSSVKHISPSLHNSFSVYTGIKHNIYSNLASSDPGSIVSSIQFAEDTYSFDIYQNEHPTVYNTSDDTIRVLDNIVLDDLDIFTGHPYPGIMNLHSGEIASIFTTDGNLLLFVASVPDKDMASQRRKLIIGRDGNIIDNDISADSWRGVYVNNHYTVIHDNPLTHEDLLNVKVDDLWYRGNRYSRSDYILGNSLFLRDPTRPGSIYLFTTNGDLSPPIGGRIKKIVFDRSDTASVSPTNIDMGTIVEDYSYSMWHNLLFPVNSDSYSNPTVVPKVSSVTMGPVGIGQLHNWPEFSQFYGDEGQFYDSPLDNSRLHVINGRTHNWLLYINNPNPHVTHLNSSVGNAKIGLHKVDSGFKVESTADWEDIINPLGHYTSHDIRFSLGESAVLRFSESIFIDTLSTIIPDYLPAYDYASMIDSRDYGTGGGWHSPSISKMTILTTTDGKDNLAINFEHAKHSNSEDEKARKTNIYGNFISIGSFDFEKGDIVLDKTILIEKVISEYIYNTTGVGNSDSNTFDAGNDNSSVEDLWTYSTTNMLFPYTGDKAIKGNAYNCNIDLASHYNTELWGDSGMYPGDTATIQGYLEELKVIDAVNYYPFTIKDMCFSADASVLYIVISYYGNWNLNYSGAYSNGPKYLGEDFYESGFGDRIYKINLVRDDSGSIINTQVSEVPPFLHSDPALWPADFEDSYSENGEKHLPIQSLSTRSPYFDITKMYRGTDGFIYLGIASREDLDEYPAYVGRIVNQDSYENSSYALGMKTLTSSEGVRNEHHIAPSKDTQYSLASLNTDRTIRFDRSKFEDQLIDESELSPGTSGCLNVDDCNYCSDCSYHAYQMCNPPNPLCGCEGTLTSYPYGPCGPDVGGCSTSSTNQNEFNFWSDVLVDEGAAAQGQYLAENYIQYNTNVPDCLVCGDAAASNGVSPLPEGVVSYPELDTVLCTFPGCSVVGSCNYDPDANINTGCNGVPVGWTSNITTIYGLSPAGTLDISPANITWPLSIPNDAIHPDEDGTGHATFLHCECNGMGGLVPMEGWCGSCGTAGVSGTPTAFYHAITQEELPVGFAGFMQNYGDNTIFPESPYCNCAGTEIKEITGAAVDELFDTGLAGIMDDAQWWLGSVGSSNPIKYCDCGGGLPTTVACDCDGDFLGNVPASTQSNGVCDCDGTRPWDLYASTSVIDNTCDCSGDVIAAAVAAGYCPGCTTDNVQLKMYPDTDGDGFGECYAVNPYYNPGAAIIEGGNTGDCSSCYYEMKCPTNTDASNPELPSGWSLSCGDNCTETIDECGVCGGSGIPAEECDCDGNVLDCAEVCGGTSTTDEGTSGGHCCEPATQMTYYYDADGDGLGNYDMSLVLCPNNPITNTGGCTGAGCYVQDNNDPDDTCAGVYDQCDVCNGDNSCLDCLGEPFGSAEVDECDVCDGDNSTCADCAGVANGFAYSDDCGDCVGSCENCVPEANYNQNICGVCNEPDPLPGQCCEGEFLCECEGDGTCLPDGSECSEDLGCGCGLLAPEDYACPADCDNGDTYGCCDGYVWDECMQQCMVGSSASYQQTVSNPCNPSECVSPALAESSYVCTYCTDPEAENYLHNCDGVLLGEIPEGEPVFDSGCCEYAVFEDPSIDSEVDVVGNLAPYIEAVMVAVPETYEECTTGQGVSTPAAFTHITWQQHSHESVVSTSCPGTDCTDYEYLKSFYSGGDLYSVTLKNRSFTEKCQVIKNNHKKIYVDNVGYNGEVIFSGLTEEYVKTGRYFNVIDASHFLVPQSIASGGVFSPYDIYQEENPEGCASSDNPYSILCGWDRYITPNEVLLTDSTTFGDPIQYLPPISGATYIYKPQFYFRLDADIELSTYDPNVLFAEYADKIEKVERFWINTPDGVGLSTGGVATETNMTYFEHIMNPTAIVVYNPMTGSTELLNKGNRYTEAQNIGEAGESIEYPDGTTVTNWENNTRPAYWVYKITPKTNASGVYEEFVIDLDSFTPPEVVGMCTSADAINTGFTANGDTITDVSIINDTINGDSPLYNTDNSLCNFSNCDGIFENVCCADTYINSIQNQGLTPSDIGVYGGEHECKVCNFSVCEATEVCTDQTAIDWTDTSLLSGIAWTINNDLCTYPEIAEGDLRIDVWVNVSNLDNVELSRLEWLIYSTQQNIMLQSPNILSVSAEGGVAHYSVPLLGLPACTWLLPLGVDEAEVWTQTLLQINSGPVGSPYTHHEIAYGATNTPGGSIPLNAVGIGGCPVGCNWASNDLITEHCVHYIQEDEDEFTELFLEIDTAYVQENPDAYKCASVNVINISSNEVMVGQTSFAHNSQTILTFNVTGDTKVGIKVNNPPCGGGGRSINDNYPIKYTLKTEQGEILTTKTIY